MQFYILNLMASVYGDGAYGECAYNEGCAESTTNGGTGAVGAGSGLADTGTWIVALVTLACLLIFIALLTRWLARRSSKKSATGMAKAKTPASRKE